MKLVTRFSIFLWQKNLLPARFARVVYKRLSRKDQTPDHPFVTDFYGIRYQGNLKNNIDFNIYFYGAFEKPLLYFLRDTMQSLAPASPLFVDIGANVGQHSLFMATHGCQVHSFEPFVAVRERLQLQIDNNRLSNITVHPFGLSNENSKLPFFAPTGSNVGIGSFDATTTSKGNVNIGELDLVNGDDYLQRQNINNINLIKMDVEGFEKPALQGLRETLRQSRPVLVCEVTYGKSLSFNSIAELLTYLPEGYELYTFDKRKSDGSKARRRGAKSRQTGSYRVVPYAGVLQSGQDDVIACPREKLERLPREN